MGDKSPKKNNAKKPAKTIKEKRAAKQEKRHPTTGFGGDLGGQGRTVDPPSTLITWAVIQLASSDMRNATAAAMSSGSPRRGERPRLEREVAELLVRVFADRLGEHHARRDAVRRGCPRGPNVTTRAA